MPPEISIAVYQRLLAEARAGQQLAPDDHAALQALLAQYHCSGGTHADAVAAMMTALASDAPEMVRLNAAITVAAQNRFFEEALLRSVPDAAIDDETLGSVIREAMVTVVEPNGVVALEAVRAYVRDALPQVAPERIHRQVAALQQVMRAIGTTEGDVQRLRRLWEERGIPTNLSVGEAVERGYLTRQELFARHDSST